MKLTNRIRITLLSVLFIVMLSCKKKEDPAPASNETGSNKIQAQDDYLYISGDGDYFTLPVLSNDSYNKQKVSVKIMNWDVERNYWSNSYDSSAIEFSPDMKPNFGYFTNTYKLYLWDKQVKIDSSEATIHLKVGTDNQIHTDSLLKLTEGKYMGLYAVDGDTSYAYDKNYNEGYSLFRLQYHAGLRIQVPDISQSGYFYFYDLQKVKVNGSLDMVNSLNNSLTENFIVKDVFLTTGLKNDGTETQLTIIRIKAMGMTVDYVVNPAYMQNWFE